MRQGGLQGEIASILSTMQPTTMIQCQAVEWAIRSAFEVREVPEFIVEEIRRARRAVGEGAVAVRSSAMNEDSPQQSFVGQHATILNVRTDDQAVEAVVACWQSLFSARAIAYAQRFGLDLQSSSMAVLLQPMVTPSAQGALFTVDPVTGNADRFMLEIQDGPDAGLHVLDPYHSKRGEPPLWSQLRHLGLLLDERRRTYFAIEWLIADEQLYIIRARPVTGVPRYLPKSEIESGLGRGPAHLVCDPELTPRAARPFSWYQRSRNQQLNVARTRYAHRLFAEDTSRSDFYLCGYLYTRRDVTGAANDDREGAMQEWSRRAQRLYLVRHLDRPFQALWHEKRPRLDALRQDDLAALAYPEIAPLLREMMGLHEAFWAECGRLGDSAEVTRQILCDLGRLWLHEELPSDDLVAVYDDAVTQGRERLCDLVRSQGDDLFQGHLARLYRHQYLQADPLAPWADCCSLPDGQAGLEAARDVWCDFSALGLREQNQARLGARDALERELLGRLRSWQRPLFQHVVRLARRYRRDSLDCSEAVTLCRLLERDMVLEIGRRLCAEGIVSAAEDVGLLAAPEILDWLSAPSRRDEIIRLVIQRKDLARRWHRYAPPAVVGEAESHTVPPPDYAERYAGVPISAGVATGRARLIQGAVETAGVLPGEVLVCLDPLFEYAPVFGLVSAVVAERGQLLDHASVLTREYGVPAVFGVKGITRAVRTGDELVVLASQGLVYRPSPEPTWEV
jgi:phosphohistidine swiveling domain-containing protein